MAAVARVLSRRFPATQSEAETPNHRCVLRSRPGPVTASGSEQPGYQRRISLIATIIVRGAARDSVKLFRSSAATK
jgi:hypothetical protein